MWSSSISARLIARRPIASAPIAPAPIASAPNASAPQAPAPPAAIPTAAEPTESSSSSFLRAIGLDQRLELLQRALVALVHAHLHQGRHQLEQPARLRLHLHLPART